MQVQTFGTFEKDGQTRTAFTPAQRVALEFDGWKLADDATSVEVTPPGPPPATGRGSGRDAWAEYAAAHGQTVDADQSRDDIIAALTQAGIPTE